MTQAATSDPSAGGAGASRLLSDDRLARRATKGDRHAFEAIYERYHRDLYRFCLALVGNPQDAQDALQNTMVKVLRALPGEKRHIQLKPWLYRIARNEAVETVRKRRDSAEIEPDQTASTEDVVETAATRERLRRLIVDLEELPERQRAALVMRELAGLGFAQIGEAFETSAAVARQTVYEARLSLRQMEEGREMSCDRVMRELSDADGRVTRRREVRAHLRSCASCRAFRDSMAERRGEFAAIAPLPLALSAGLLHGILSGNASAANASAAGGMAGAGGGGAGGLAGTIGAGAGKAVATSAVLKSVATVAVVAAVGVTAADRSGLIHVPLLGGGAKSSQTSSPPPGSAGPATQQGKPASERAGSTAGGGTGRAGSGRGASAGAQGGHSGSAASGAGARRAGSGRGASAQARSAGHGRSHAGRHGQRTGAGHGKRTAATHKAATMTSKQSHSGRRSSRSHRSPAKRSPHHTGGARVPPPKPAPPKQEGAATPPASPTTPTEPPASGTSGSVRRPVGGVE
jgi:RNA polymerase sigma factor (sigma-70 family)